MHAKHVLLALVATLAHALPGGGWDGSGQHDDPKHHGGQPGAYDGEDCETKPLPQPAYSKPEPVYTKHEGTWSNPAPVYSKSKDYPKPTSTFTCPTTCRLIYHGTFLAYPTVIEYSSVYAETINAYVTEYADGSPGQTVEETVTAPPAPTTAPLTWNAFGVDLTYPTTYVAYFSIAYQIIVPLPAQSTCSSKSAELQYPRVWPSLIADSTSIRQPGSIPPATIVQWIDSLPTVREQLGGNICDPVFGGLQPFTPTATVTSATTIAGNTRIVQTTVVTPATVAPAPPPTTSVATTSAPPPPPPPPPSTPPPPPPAPPVSSTTRSPAIQTVNAAVLPRQIGAGSWVGNAVAALLLAL